MVAIVVGLVWFLIRQGLDRGDKWASIGSLLFGVATLTYSVVSGSTKSTSEKPVDAPNSATPWIPEDDCGIISVVTDPADLPAWPTEFPGYRRSTPKPTYDHSAPHDQQPPSDKEWITESATVRVFGGQGLSVIDSFPATMNGGRHQRFLVRWRTLDGTDVAMKLVSVPDRLDVHPTVYGSAGYVSSHALGQPAWEIVYDDHRLVDVQVSWQRWVPDV